MTNEQEALAKRIAEERSALKAAMAKLPFDFDSAGSTRIQAWRIAHAEAQKVLNRNPTAIAPYAEARRRLIGTGSASVEELSKEMFGE